MARRPRLLMQRIRASRRLLEGEASPRERFMLEAGLDEAPPDDRGRRQTLAALGVGVGVGAGASAVAGTAKAALLGGGRAALFGWVKAIGLGALAGGLVVGVAEVIDDAHRAHAPAVVVPTQTRPQPLPSGRAVSERATRVPPVASAEVPPVVLSDPALSPPAAPTPGSIAQGGGAPSRALPASPEPPNAELRVADAPAAPPSGGGTSGESVDPGTASSELADQVAALDRARAALSAGRPAECESLLGDFERRFPRSTLAPEATVMRVGALLSQGKRAAATDVVRAYCQSGRRGAYARRLLSLVGLTESECESLSPRR